MGTLHALRGVQALAWITAVLCVISCPLVTSGDTNVSASHASIRRGRVGGRDRSLSELDRGLLDAEQLMKRMIDAAGADGATRDKAEAEAVTTLLLAAKMILAEQAKRQGQNATAQIATSIPEPPPPTSTAPVLQQVSSGSTNWSVFTDVADVRQPIDKSSRQRVVIMPEAGMGNRLRAMVAGITFAQTIGLPAHVKWNTNSPGLGSAHTARGGAQDLKWGHLFSDNHPDFTVSEWSHIHGQHGWQNEAEGAICQGCSRKEYASFKNCERCSWWPDGPRPRDRDLLITGGSYCDQFPQFLPNNTRAVALKRMCAEAALKLYPSKEIQTVLDDLDLSAEYDIGVHLRTGDGGKFKFPELAKEGCTSVEATTEAFAKAIRKFEHLLGENPKRRIYMASDDKNKVDYMVKAFPKGKVLDVDQIMQKPQFKSLNPMAIDLWALASTSLIVGSPSTFSTSAAALLHRKKLYIVDHCDGGVAPGLDPEEAFCESHASCIGARDYYDSSGKLVEVD